MKKAVSAALAAAMILSAVSLSGCGAQKKEYSSFAMGSVFTAGLYADSEEKADEIYEELNELLQDTDKRLSATREDGEITALNEAGSASVSDYTAEIVSNSLMLCGLSGKKLDVTIGAVSQLWGFATDEPRLPDDGDIREALATVDCEKVAADTARGRITLGEGQKIDLGAVGKGAALERLIDALRPHRCPAVLFLGGTVAVYGKSPKKSGWSVGIQTPGGEGYMGVYSLVPDTESGALYISTSGKYEKNFTENGKTYHHILSTETGYPVETDLVSVTAVTPGGLTADALSTILFITGLNEEAMTLIKNFGAGALFIYEDGSVYCVGKYADGFRLTDAGAYALKEYEAA